MADASKVLKYEFISSKELPTPTVVTVIGKGGYYPSKFKNKEQLAVIVNFKGVQRRLGINTYSLKEIGYDVDFTMETENWVGRKLQIFKRKTQAGGTYTIHAKPFKKQELRAIVS